MKTFFHSQISTFSFTPLGKRVTHPLIAVLLSIVFVFLSVVGAELLSVPLQPLVWGLAPLFSHQPAIFSALGMILNLLIPFGCIYLLVWGWLLWFEHRPFWSLGFFRQDIFPRYLVGLTTGLLMISAMIGIALLLHAGRFLSTRGPMEGLPALGGILLVSLGWAVQASAEEALYRGWLLPVISIRTRLWIGILLSSLCFAGAHALNNGFSPLVLCNLFLFGLFLALYRIADGSLWGVCAWHTAWNWALGNIFGVNNGGGTPEGGSLFHLSLIGPDWLTGGAFGPEGSIATTTLFLICIVVVLLLLYWRRRDDRGSIR